MPRDGAVSGASYFSIELNINFKPGVPPMTMKIGPMQAMCAGFRDLGI
jgi:hypothetical protein